MKLNLILIITIAIIIGISLSYPLFDNWKEEKTCTRMEPFFNITAEEYNCPLYNCKTIIDKPVAVQECTCEITNTLVYRYCSVYTPSQTYVGNVDSVRESALKKYPELSERFNKQTPA